MLRHALLTLCKAVSLILSPALLTAEYKNEPNDLAPAVTLVVTVLKRQREKKIEEKKIYNTHFFNVSICDVDGAVKYVGCGIYV